MAARTPKTATPTATKTRTRKPKAETAPAETPTPQVVAAPAQPALTDAERTIADKYGIEVKAGSLRYDEQLQKKVLTMYCVVCHNPRQIATQDAFQVKTCGGASCKKAHKKSEGK